MTVKEIEVMAALFYNAEKRDWLAEIPKQRGGASAIAYEGLSGSVPEGYFFHGTIHSHPNMQAFWSGVDLADQLHKAGLHLVVGTRDGEVTSKKCSLFLFGREFDAADCFEFPEEVPEPPAAWVAFMEEQIKQKKELSERERKAVPRFSVQSYSHGNSMRKWPLAGQVSCSENDWLSDPLLNMDYWGPDFSELDFALKTAENNISRDGLLYYLLSYWCDAGRAVHPEAVFKITNEEALKKLSSLSARFDKLAEAFLQRFDSLIKSETAAFCSEEESTHV